MNSNIISKMILSKKCDMTSSFTYDSKERLIEKMSSKGRYLVEKKYRYDGDRLAEMNENTYEGKGMKRSHLGSGRELYHYDNDGKLMSSEQFVDEKRISRTEYKRDSTTIIYKLAPDGSEYVESELIHGEDFTNDHTYSLDKNGKVYLSGISATTSTGADIQVKDETGKTMYHVNSKKDDSIDENFPFEFASFTKEYQGFEERIRVKKVSDTRYEVKMIRLVQSLKVVTKETWIKLENGVFIPTEREQYCKSNNSGNSPTTVWVYEDHPDFIVLTSKFDEGLMKDIYSKKVNGMCENFIYYHDNLARYKVETSKDGFKLRYDESGLSDFHLEVKEEDDERIELIVDPDERNLRVLKYNSTNLLVSEFGFKEVDQEMIDNLFQIFFENCKVNDSAKGFGDSLIGG